MPIEVARMGLEYSYAGVGCVTTHHFKGDFPTATLADLVGAWQASCQDAFLAVLPPEYTFDRIVVEIEPVPGVPALYGSVTAVDVPGTRAHESQDLDPFLVLWSTVRTGTINRRARGRYALSGGTEGDVSGRSLETGSLFWTNRVQAYGDALVAEFGADSLVLVDWTMCVYSRVQRHSGSSADASSTPVVGIEMRPVMRALRSRKA